MIIINATQRVLSISPSFSPPPKTINMGDCVLHVLFSVMHSAGAEAKFDETDVKLKHPFSLVLAEASGSGKTQVIKNIIFKNGRVIKPAIEHVIWFYTSEQNDVFNEIGKELGHDRVEFVRGLPLDTTIEEYILGRHGPKLVVIDDLMSEANTRSDVNHLFTRGRHLDTSIAFLVQNFHNKGKYMRENTLNADYLVLFRNPRDTIIVSHLARQMGQRKLVMASYKLATQDKPFSYLFVDLRTDTDERLRLRGDLLAKYPVFFLALDKSYK